MAITACSVKTPTVGCAFGSPACVRFLAQSRYVCIGCARLVDHQTFSREDFRMPDRRGWFQNPDDPPGVQRWYDGNSWTGRTTGEPQRAPVTNLVNKTPDSQSPHRAVFWNPVSEQGEAARRARERGDRLFQVQLQVGDAGGDSRWGSSTGEVRGSSDTSVLADVEGQGWHLEHVSHVFVETGSKSTDRLLRSGQGTVSQGVILGIYLFRAV